MLPDIKLDNVLTYGSEGQYYTTNLRLATNGMALTLADTRDDERVTLDNNLLNIRIQDTNTEDGEIQWINHWTLESLNALLSGFGWKASYVNDKSLEVQIAPNS